MPTDRPSRWSFYIDRGGTFTDVVAHSPDGEQHTLKLLSENPDHYDDPVIEAIRRLLNVDPEMALPTECIQSVYIGTTLATNALLEQTGARVLLLTQTGFENALLIGHQDRGDLFARTHQPPTILYESSLGISGRVNARGELTEPLDYPCLERILQNAHDSGLTSLAVCLFHAHLYPDLEKAIGELAQTIGFSHISLSHEISPVAGWVDRAQTTLVDAYLSPIIQDYAKKLHQALNPPNQSHQVDLKFMKSDGGLTQYDAFRGHQAILSGPAAGLVGCLRSAQALGISQVVAFDMGGTSTDVAYLSDGYDKSTHHQINGLALTTPMLDIHTIASGGGSCIGFDGHRFQVGPRSAGAQPGPACYGLEGPLTTTDCNLFLGRLSASYLPQHFGKDGNQPVDTHQTKHLFQRLAEEVSQATGEQWIPEKIAQGCIDIATLQMAQAIKKVSSQRGHDVSQAALNCFGGAGGQHALAVAETLGIDTVIVHPLSGVLSAVGLSMASPTSQTDFSIECPLDQLDSVAFDAQFVRARTKALDQLKSQRVNEQDIELRERVNLAYEGSHTQLTLPRLPKADLVERFEALHQQRFGMIRKDASLYVTTGSVEARQKRHAELRDSLPKKDLGTLISSPLAYAPVYVHNQWTDVPIWHLDTLSVEQLIEGPALVITDHATVVVLNDWHFKKTSQGTLILTKTSAAPAITNSHSSNDTHDIQHADPIRLEIFNGLFSSVTEHMGTLLAQTAWSANIKERRDFSCALFNAKGELIANAPHVPVHLGSMGASVKSVIDRFADTLLPGDGFLLNDPFNGGTHLPDLTLISPGFDDSNKLIYWVANRAHHADIGGLTPGSMPSHSQHICEEGVLFQPMRIVQSGILNEEMFIQHLTGAAYPARNPSQNIADLYAQIAANRAGLTEMTKILGTQGQAETMRYMEHVLSLGEQKTKKALAAFNFIEPQKAQSVMDHGQTIAVTLAQQANRLMRIDFTGTSTQRDSNVNAPAAITRACVLYVLRWLVAEEIPLNDGCLRAVEIIIPPDSLLNPAYPSPVVAGNVETSQVITDTILAAFGLSAHGPGTMNNLTFGTDDFQHYETLCGGGGASRWGPGSTGRHVHMTNSRLTDPEVLESRFPVTLVAFGICHQSGGDGQFRGGDGVFRIMQFDQSMQVTLLGNRRLTRPKGLMGGGDGQVATNCLIKPDKTEHALPGCITLQVHGGERLVVHTPSGGGFGKRELP